MGLDAYAYERATLLEDHPDPTQDGPHTYDDCYESDHIRTFAYASFWQSFRGLRGVDERIRLFGGSEREYVGGHYYEVGGRSESQHNSYGGFSDFRTRLCAAMFEVPLDGYRDPLTGDHREELVDPGAYWSNVEDYREEPFFEFLWFADNEGNIGPEAATDLAKDFAEHAAVVERGLRSDGVPWDEDYYVKQYRQWRKMFELAAEGGLVEYH